MRARVFGIVALATAAAAACTNAGPLLPTTKAGPAQKHLDESTTTTTTTTTTTGDSTDKRGSGLFGSGH